MNKVYKLGIFETHPIQYKIPWFRQLEARDDIDLTVFYCLIPDAKQQGAGFGVEFKWDLPLLEGYNYQVLNNISEEPGTYSHKGCDTPEIYQILKEANPKYDAIIINGWVVKSCVQALRACNKLKIPAILRCEANNLAHRAWWKTLIHKQILKRFSAVIAIGTSNKEFYTSRGIAEHLISMGYYCVENDRIAHLATQSSREEVRTMYKIPQEAICLVFSGKFEEKKSPLEIIKAFELAQKQNENLHLMMIGDGELKESCQKYVDRQKLAVTFTGFVNQSKIPSFYKASDCLILASDYGETWGLVINEGMACGLPALVSNHIGSHFDLIIEGETGYLIDYNNLSDIAEKISTITTDTKKLKLMGSNAQEHIKNFSIDTLTQATLDSLKYLDK
jgi:glycosyltransferase involved in cell wall biosynthesis